MGALIRSCMYVFEPRQAKSRMHLELRLVPKPVRVMILGAEVLTPEPIGEEGFYWVVMADLGANEPERPPWHTTPDRRSVGQRRSLSARNATLS